MKQLSSFMVINIDGGDRVSYTYNEINDETGNLVNQNIKKNFVSVDPVLASHIEAIRDYIRTRKLSEGGEGQ